MDSSRDKHLENPEGYFDVEMFLTYVKFLFFPAKELNSDFLTNTYPSRFGYYLGNCELDKKIKQYDPITLKENEKFTPSGLFKIDDINDLIFYDYEFLLWDLGISEDYRECPDIDEIIEYYGVLEERFLSGLCSLEEKNEMLSLYIYIKNQLDLGNDIDRKMKSFIQSINAKGKARNNKKVNSEGQPNVKTVKKEALDEIKNEWIKWRISEKIDYPNNSIFSVEMADKYNQVKESTILSHCGLWGKQHGLNLKKGRPSKK